MEEFHALKNMPDFIELNQKEKTVYVNPGMFAEVEIFQGRITITFPSGKTIVLPASHRDAVKVLNAVRNQADGSSRVSNFNETKKSGAFNEAPYASGSAMIKNLLDNGDEKSLRNPREVKAEELVAAGKVEKRRDKYFVEETLPDETLVEYMVFRDAAKRTLCSCEDFKNISPKINPDFVCEHIFAVRIFAKGQAR